MTQARPPLRLYVPAAYAGGQTLALGAGQSHYLAHVMRCREGDAVALFNGEDGEWRAEIAAIHKKAVTLRLDKQLAAQASSPDLWLAFAPIKSKTDLVAEKAVELGVSMLLPVVTRHAVVRSVNGEKLAAHAIEAAEQCGRCDVPIIRPYDDLGALLADWPHERLLLYGDESGGGAALKLLLPSLAGRKLAVLIGPEGGFSAEEHRLLKAAPMVRPFSLGPRILRADTAAIAALACVQAWCGDWGLPSTFETRG